MATGRAPFEDPPSAVAGVLAEAGISLVASTSTGQVLLVREASGRLAVDEHPLAGAGGLGVAPGWLALAGAEGIWELRDEPAMVPAPGERRLDAVYVPRRFHPIGGPVVDPFRGAEGVTWFVDVAGSCLATTEAGAGVVPRWRSPRRTGSLSGVAASAGVARYVTAVGAADDGGGQVIEVDSGEVVATALGLPRSPRLHESRLWLLDARTGVLAMVDRASGELTTVTALSGSTRGLAFVGNLAFVGLSGAPAGGIAVVDLRTGLVRARLHLPAVPEVVDLQVVPHRTPELLDLTGHVVAGAKGS